MVRMGWVLVALAVASASAAAEAQEPLPNATELATQTAKRFPMPVRVGEMIGQDVLQPTESQPVLGRVEQVRRNGDGGAATGAGRVYARATGVATNGSGCKRTCDRCVGADWAGAAVPLSTGWTVLRKSPFQQG